jgi:hypothetical protein
MTIQQIQSRFNLSANTSAMVNSIMGKKGQFAHIKYLRPLKFKKGFEGVNYGFKEVTGVFRIGAEYENLKSTIEKRKSGICVGGLNGRNWAVYPYLLESTNNKLLVRVYTAKNTKNEIKFFINGKLANLEQLNEMCLQSELDTSDKPMFDINLDYIKEIY